MKYVICQEIPLQKQAKFHQIVSLFMEVLKCIYLHSFPLKYLVNDLSPISGLLTGGLTFPLKFTGTAKNVIL